jgi:hypothetical protein
MFGATPYMSAKPHKVGDPVRVSMHGGKIVDAVIKAVIEHKDGLRFQVAFGHDPDCIDGEWQIVKTRNDERKVATHSETIFHQRTLYSLLLANDFPRESYLDSSTSRWLSFCIGRLSWGYSFVIRANCSPERLDVSFRMYQITPSVQGGVVSEPI